MMPCRGKENQNADLGHHVLAVVDEGHGHGSCRVLNRTTLRFAPLPMLAPLLPERLQATADQRAEDMCDGSLHAYSIRWGAVVSAMSVLIGFALVLEQARRAFSPFSTARQHWHGWTTPSCRLESP